MKAIDPEVAEYFWQRAIDMRVSFARLSMFIEENVGDYMRCQSLVHLIRTDCQHFCVSLYAIIRKNVSH
jgi:hypothetical protein